ncbi:sensor histidine kinase [Gallicola sp. Sow4_E12]|uniref:sensor histidine kinase n=1 Tax=Gallicola sp. Sow4_E12 TaxID=3438785 RepID=UPI003F8DED3C
MRRLLTRYLIVIIVVVTMLTIFLQSVALQDDLIFRRQQVIDEIAQNYKDKEIENIPTTFQKARVSENPSLSGKVSAQTRDVNGEEWVFFEEPPNYLDLFMGVLPSAVGIIVLEILTVQLIGFLITKKILKEFNPEEHLVTKIFQNDIVTTKIDELNPFIEEIQLEKQKMDYSYDKIQQSEKMRTEFTANITHELKTPLTSISGYGEMIQHDIAKGEDVKKFAGIIQAEAKKLLELIDNIINLSKYDGSTKLNIFFEEFNIGELGREIAEDYQNIIGHKRLKLVTMIEDIGFYGDKEKIDELITNLLSNATKYNVEEGSISLKIYRELNNVKIIVEDTGLGMTEEEQRRIFERFYVADKSRGKKSGTGLGLSLVKHVAIIHGGKVSVQSQLDKGSVFVVTLPIELPEE